VALASAGGLAVCAALSTQGLRVLTTVKRFTVRNAMWRVSYSTLSVLDGRTYLNWTGMLVTAMTRVRLYRRAGQMPL
jgi:hypothetical protein